MGLSLHLVLRLKERVELYLYSPLCTFTAGYSVNIHNRHNRHSINNIYNRHSRHNTHSRHNRHITEACIGNFFLKLQVTKHTDRMRNKLAGYTEIQRSLIQSENKLSQQFCSVQGNG
jgi:hypothetical protein